MTFIIFKRRKESDCLVPAAAKTTGPVQAPGGQVENRKVFAKLAEGKDRDSGN